jgi:hypothetical protein
VKIKMRKNTKNDSRREGKCDDEEDGGESWGR